MTEPAHRVLIGDCRESMRTLPAGSVHCCVTSPPYWALRDYGVNGQLGMEKTPDEYIAAMVDVFREVKRVLRDDGTCWINIGDSYDSSGKWGGQSGKKHSAATAGQYAKRRKPETVPCGGCGETDPEKRCVGCLHDFGKSKSGLKPKDLVGIPWRLAFALQADGWYLRQDIIWSKPAPMPESVRDRCTKSHEYIFLLTKRPRYFYDAEAVKERGTGKPCGNTKPTKGGREHENGNGKHRTSASLHKIGAASSRNRRSVWTIPDAVVMRWLADHAPEVAAEFIRHAENKPDTWTINTEAFRGAHFATFPTKLVEPCILAGTSAAGCCAECGKPWERETVSTRVATRIGKNFKVNAIILDPQSPYQEHNGDICGNRDPKRHCTVTETVGWRATCQCNAPAVPCTVLDPFGGSGTTAGVALYHRRNAILCELNPEYAAMVPGRIDDVIRRMRKREAKRAAKKQAKPLANQKTLWSDE